MSTTLHSTIHPTSPTNQGIHVIHNYVYSDAATRLAASGFSSTDIGKVALQSDDGSFWLLTATTPTWEKLNVWLTKTQTITNSDTSPVTLDVNADCVEIELNNADLVLVVPSGAPVNKVWQLNRYASGTHTVALRPFSGGNINGGTTNADMTIPGFDVPLDPAASHPACQVRVRSATSIGVC